MLDTNILIYHLTQNHTEHSNASTALLRKVELGEQEIYCPSTAILESTFVLQKQFNVDRKTIASLLGGFLLLPSVQSEYKKALLRALTFWQENQSIEFPDCYHLALTKELGMSHIYSFDKKMDRFPGVERLEPGLPTEVE